MLPRPDQESILPYENSAKRTNPEPTFIERSNSCMSFSSSVFYNFYQMQEVELLVARSNKQVTDLMN